MERIRLLLVDDQILFVESLELVIRTIADNIDVVGVAHSGRDGIELAHKLDPDVVLMDVRMPDIDGVEATEMILSENLDIRVMMLTTFDDDAYVQEAIRAGASGYVLKDIAPEELIASIRALHAGTGQFSPSVIHHAGTRQQTVAASRLKDSPFRSLTRRETEILALLATGLDNVEIAGRLFVAERTVKNHVSMIYSKLNIHDRTKVARLAARHGLLWDSAPRPGA